MTWSFDRLARSVVHFLQVLDELNHLGIAFVSRREQVDSEGPLGRAFIVIVAAISELERSLIVERVRCGLRRAKLEGRAIGRPALVLDREAILQDRRRGQSLGQIARTYRISRTTVRRVLCEKKPLASPVPKGLEKPAA